MRLKSFVVRVIDVNGAVQSTEEKLASKVTFL